VVASPTEPGDMMEPPTYTVATDFDKIKQLRDPRQPWRLLQLLNKAPEH
jgi:hypothetical protein